MSSQEIAQTQQKIYDCLLHRHLQQAFELLHTLADTLQEWSVNARLTDLETSYRYMIQYMLDGVEDPGREHVYKRLIAQTYSITDTICEKMLIGNSSMRYYTTKRAIRTSGRSMAQTFTLLDNAINELSLCELIPDNKATLSRRKQVEQYAVEMFNHVWTNYPAEAEDLATIQEALQPHHLPAPIAALITSALTLNIIHRFDATKIDILIDTYQHSDNQESQVRAICAILIALTRHGGRLQHYDNLRSRISLLFDTPAFIADTRNIIFQFIRSRDTEKISRKLTEEILPKMMKISPSLYKKIKEDDALLDIESLEHNPEWQELLDQSGITNNLMELNDLQMQGADVFMSTFAHLKGFPFFNDISNWFIPFVTNHTDVINALGEEDWGKKLADILKSSAFLCNSDKYSFCLSLSQAPESQRKMMASQFRAENMHIQEEDKTELHRESKVRENISNRYIQDLYRFYKLYPGRNEFYDIFTLPIKQLLHVDTFSHTLLDDTLLKILGEYFFKNGNYTDAAYIFDILTAHNFTNNELYEKNGFCYQSLGEYEEALELYLKADLIKPNNVWTLRHIAICYRNLKQTEKAIEYFLRAGQIDPDNISINLNIGHCYLEQKQYEKALNYYFKVEFLDSKGTKARRPIAWCSFLSGKSKQAWGYYEKILIDKPNSLDYLNAAHVQLSLGNKHQAIALYLQSIEHDKNNIDNFSRNFEQDFAELIQAGIPPEELPIIHDEVLYRAKEQNKQ